VPFFKASPLREADVLVAAFALPAKRASLPAEAAVLVVTRAGLIKKTLVSELPGPSAQTFTLARINDGDALVSTMMSDGKRDVLLLTTLGMAIRFTEGEVRPMGLVAAGVSGIRLDDKDSVIAAEVLPAPGEVLLLASDGRAKRIDQKEFPVQGRYGKGVNAWSLPGKIRLAGAVAVKGSSAVTIHLAKGAPKANRPDAAGVRKRASTRGDKLVDLKPGDSVVGLTTGWMVERYVQFTKVELPGAKKSARTPSTKRAAGGKKKPPTRKGSGKKAKTKDKKPARKRGR
jgi:DNA gyrase subunit A